MKLTNLERTAIAQSIYDELSREINKNRKEAVKNAWKEFYKTPVGKAFKIVQEADSNFVYESRVENTLFDLSYKYPDRSLIERELIISQIDSVDLTEMIQKLTDKFKKQYGI